MDDRAVTLGDDDAVDEALEVDVRLCDAVEIAVPAGLRDSDVVCDAERVVCGVLESPAVTEIDMLAHADGEVLRDDAPEAVCVGVTVSEGGLQVAFDFAPMRSENVPGGQCVGTTEATRQKVSAGHSTHVVLEEAPIVELDVPAGHGTGLTESKGQ